MNEIKKFRLDMLSVSDEVAFNVDMFRVFMWSGICWPNLMTDIYYHKLKTTGEIVCGCQKFLKLSIIYYPLQLMNG